MRTSSARNVFVSDRRGSALVEFALVIPLLLLLFAGIVDFAFLFQRYQILTNAVREGARIAVLPANLGEATVSGRVREYVREGLSMTAAPSVEQVPVTLTPHVMTENGTDYAVVTVHAQLTYQYLVIGHVARLMGADDGPWGSIALQAAATMRSEVQ